MVLQGGSARRSGGPEARGRALGHSLARRNCIEGLQCANCWASIALGGAALMPRARRKAAVYCGRKCQKEHGKALGGGNKCACFTFSG